MMAATNTLTLVAMIAAMAAAPASASDWPTFLKVPAQAKTTTPGAGATTKNLVPRLSAAEVEKKNMEIMSGYLDRKMCRYTEEAACVANSCHWCLGVCAVPTATSSCVQESADNDAFEKGLEAIFGEEGEAGADEEGEAGPGVERQAAEAAGRGATTLFLPKFKFPNPFKGLLWKLEVDVVTRSSIGVMSQRLSFSVFKTGTIDAVKKVVASKTGIEAARLTLTYNGKVLKGSEVILRVLKDKARLGCSVAPPPPTPAPTPVPTPAPTPAPTLFEYVPVPCGSKCKRVRALCRLTLKGTWESICVTVAPYLTSIKAWKALAKNAWNIWTLFKDGGLSVGMAFTKTFQLLQYAGRGIDKLGELYATAKDFINRLLLKLKDFASATLKLVDAAKAAWLSFQLMLAKAMNPRMNNPQMCYACADEFEILSELFGLDDPCVQAITSAMWIAINGAWAATPVYFITSAPAMLDYSTCASYNQMYCSLGTTCDSFSNSAGFR